MLIKELTVDELPAVAELGPKFWKEAGLPGTFVPAVFVRNWTAFINAGLGRIFTHVQEGRPVGALGMLYVPDVNDDSLVASELFWFVEPEHRGCGISMFLHAMRVAKELGCARMSMMHLESINQESLSKIYHKMGFVPVEKHYIKSLT